MKPLAILLILASIGQAQTGSGSEPVRYTGGVSIDLNAPYSMLRPSVGVENRQVFRANRSHTELADSFGWTYNHVLVLEHITPGQTLVGRLRRPHVE